MKNNNWRVNPTQAMFMKTAFLTMTGLLLTGFANANLVMNGSFETGPGTDLGVGPGSPSIDEVNGWRAFDTSGSNAIEHVNHPNEAANGSQYIKIVSVLSGSNLGDTGFDITTTGEGEVLLNTGTTYTVTFEAKRVSGTDNSLWVSVNTKDRDTSATLETLVSEGLSLESSWTTYHYDFTPIQSAVGEERVVLYIGFRPKNGGTLQNETIYLDHVRVVPKPATLSRPRLPLSLSLSETTAHLEWQGGAATNYSVSFGTNLTTMGTPLYRLGSNNPIVHEELVDDATGFWKVEALETQQGVGVQNGQLVRFDATTETFGPFHAFGVNYYDAFLRNINDASDTSYNEGFAYLSAHHIPACRVLAAGFWPSNWALYFSNRDEYFRRLDAFVASAESYNVGLIFSLFWTVTTAGEIVDDAVDAGILVPGIDFTPASPLNTDIYGQPTYAEYKEDLGRADSGTIAFIQHYTREIVSRYGRSPAIWGWEFGNEYNLSVDHASVAGMRNRSGGTAQGMFLPDSTNDFNVLPKWTGPDDLTRAHVTVAKQTFAETVRSIDTWRLIMSGDAIPRPAAYHNWTEHSWTKDSSSEMAQVLPVDHPSPMDTVTVHIYPPASGSAIYFTDTPVTNQWLTGQYKELMDYFVAESTAMGRPLIVGEWGAIGNGTTDDEKTTFHRMMQAQIDAGVQLSLLWDFDNKNSGQTAFWWVNPDTAKDYQLTNDDPDLWDLEQANQFFNP